jgi:hypothetical protein
MTLRMGDSSDIVPIIHRHFMGKRAQLTGVEIGVHKGETSEALLRTFPQLHLFMVDPWATYETSHAYRKSGDGCASLTAREQAANCALATKRTEKFYNRRTIRAMESLQAARSFAGLADRLDNAFDGRFDFVFVDGDHTYNSVKADIEAWWPLVNNGGLLCGHDIDHPRDRRGLWGVRRAVEEHAAATGLTFEVAGSCWWFVKREW